MCLFSSSGLTLSRKDAKLLIFIELSVLRLSVLSGICFLITENSVIIMLSIKNLATWQLSVKLMTLQDNPFF